jgi:O-acetyl-ADP-ribose deacetylase (regulator of RNase III)
MIYQEKQKDLFNYYDKGYYLVHCISADFALGAGIAKEFEKRFHLREELINILGKNWYEKDFQGSAAYIHKGKNVIDLITKKRYYQKPTMESMKTALIKMKKICEKFSIEKIAMPKIGCGLDRLNWINVSEIIKDVFDDTSIEIVVCYL